MQVVLGVEAVVVQPGHGINSLGEIRWDFGWSGRRVEGPALVLVDDKLCLQQPGKGSRLCLQ